MSRGGVGYPTRYPHGVFMDDTTGAELDPQATLLARRQELQTFAEMEVYEYIRRDVAKLH